MQRKTPQSQLAIELIKAMGHASNLELAVAARKIMPSISDTTMHRITSRLAEEGVIAYAPVSDNMKVIDANVEPHDHFVCRTCGRIVDINLTPENISSIQAQLPGKLEEHSLVITGICTRCVIS